MDRPFCRMMLKVLEADRFEDMSHQLKVQCSRINTSGGGGSKPGYMCSNPAVLEHPEFGPLCLTHYTRLTGEEPEEEKAWFEFDQCQQPGCELVIHLGKYCRRHCTRKNREQDLLSCQV